MQPLLICCVAGASKQSQSGAADKCLLYNWKLASGLPSIEANLNHWVAFANNGLVFVDSYLSLPLKGSNTFILMIVYS